MSPRFPALVSFVLTSLLPACREPGERAAEGPRAPPAGAAERAAPSAAPGPSTEGPGAERTDPAVPGARTGLRAAGGPAEPPAPGDPALEDPGRVAPPAPAAPPGLAAEETSPEHPRSAETAGAGPGAGEPRLDPRCGELLAQLRRLEEGIPRDFTGYFADLPKPRIEFREEIDKAREIAEAFLESCGGAPAAPLVKAWRGRFLLGRFVPENLPLIQELGREALEGSEPSSDAHCAAASLLADVAFHHQRDYDLFRHHAGTVLRDCPQLEEDWASYRYHIAQSYIFEGRYREALEFVQGVIDENQEAPDYVLYSIALFEALYGLGDLSGIEELMHLIQLEYPERMKSARRLGLRVQYQQWADVSSFWIGFCRYAAGDIAGATEAFQENVAHIDNLELELQARGKALPNVQKVYRDFRSKDILGIVQSAQGKVPEVDLDDGVDWVTAATTLRDCRGKVVAILFRNPRNERARSLLELLAKLCARREDLVGIDLGHFSPRATDDERRQLKEALLEELRGSQLRGGFDGTPERRVYRALHAKVGTPTFTVYDREGRLAWYLVDPKESDVRIAEQAVSRLLGEDPSR